MAHSVALVLGGGGAAGNALQIGTIAGLAETGLDMTEAADLVVGTCAGPARKMLALNLSLAVAVPAGTKVSVRMASLPALLAHP